MNETKRKEKKKLQRNDDWRKITHVEAEMSENESEANRDGWNTSQYNSMEIHTQQNAREHKCSQFSS